MNESEIRVLLCDDHSLFRVGLLSILKDEPGIYIVGEAENGEDMLSQYNKLKPSIVISDISMPILTGTDAVKKLKKAYPDAKVLFLSMFYDDVYVYITKKAGGNGLLNKNITKGELVFAVKSICNGKDYFGPLYDELKVKEVMAKYNHDSIHPIINKNDQFSEIEETILLYLAKGCTSQEMADKMDVSKRTIDYHRSELMGKLDISTVAGLIIYAANYHGGRKKFREIFSCASSS